MPQQVNIQTHKLPEMKDGDDLEIFVTTFESALLSNLVPENQWKNKLHSHLTLKAKYKVLQFIKNQHSMYDELKEALLGCSAMTFSSAAEEFFTGERGRLTKLDPRQAAEKMLQLVCKLTQEAADVQEACEYVTVAALRSWMVSEL